jgi:hypothetical protein
MSESIIEQTPLSKDTDHPAVDSGAGQDEVAKASWSQSYHLDLIYGQPVIVTARWIFVFSGLIFALWNAETLGSLRVQFIAIFALALANFYLQAQLLMKRPVIDLVVYVSSAIDLLLVSLLAANQGGFDSIIYVFYFPAIAAFSVAFATRWTALYIVITMLIYAMISAMGGEPLIVITRLVMIAAVGFCGNLYRRIEKSRRQAAGEAHEALMAQMP